MPFSICPHHERSITTCKREHTRAPSQITEPTSILIINLKKNKQKQQHKQTNKYDGLVVPCRKNFRFMREESTHRCALTEPHQTMISGHKHGFAFLILQSSQGVTGVKGRGSGQWFSGLQTMQKKKQFIVLISRCTTHI